MKAPALRLLALAATVLAAVVTLPAQTTYTFFNGENLSAGFNTTGNDLTFNIPLGAVGIYDGTISGSGSLTVNGVASSYYRLQTGANNTYSGGTTLNDIVVNVHTFAPFGSGTVTLDSGNVSVLFKRNDLSGAAFANNFVVTAGAGTATIGSESGSSNSFLDFTGHLTLNRATTLLDAGSDEFGRTSFSTISGNVGTLTIQGGRVTLGGASTFTGDVVVKTNSLLQLNSPHDNPTPDPSNAYVLPLAANLTLEGTGRLRLFGSTTIGSLISASASSSISAYTSGYTLRVGANDESTTFAGSLGNTGVFTLEKIGTGTLTLTNSGNGGLSGLVISDGTLALGATNMFSNSMPLTLNGGTLDLGGYTTDLSAATLAVTANSFIDFSGNSYLYLADTSSETWTGTLTLLNFEAGNDHLFFGSNASGLTSGQLGLISVAGYTVTGLDTFGELQLTAIPEPSTYAALVGLGALGLAVVRRRRSVIAAG